MQGPRHVRNLALPADQALSGAGRLRGEGRDPRLRHGRRAAGTAASADRGRDEARVLARIAAAGDRPAAAGRRGLDGGAGDAARPRPRSAGASAVPAARVRAAGGQCGARPGRGAGRAGTVSAAARPQAAGAAVPRARRAARRPVARGELARAGDDRVSAARARLRRVAAGRGDPAEAAPAIGARCGLDPAAQRLRLVRAGRTRHLSADRGRRGGVAAVAREASPRRTPVRSTPTWRRVETFVVLARGLRPTRSLRSTTRQRIARSTWGIDCGLRHLLPKSRARLRDAWRGGTAAMGGS